MKRKDGGLAPDVGFVGIARTLAFSLNEMAAAVLSR